MRIVDLVAANPFITAPSIAGELSNAFITERLTIERLERASIVKRATDA